MSSTEARLNSHQAAKIIAAMDDKDWNRYLTPIQAAREIGASLVSPKVVVAIVDRVIHIAIGFPCDFHSHIGDVAFAQSIGSDWQQKASAFGGGDLKLNFSSGSVKIDGRSTSLGGRPVPIEAEAAVIQEVRRLMM